MIYHLALVPPMTASNAPAPYIVSASDYYMGTYEPYRAFDKSDSYGWFTAVNTTTGWISIDIGSNKKIVKYSIKGTGTATRSPKNWVFQGSVDNSVWVDLDTQTNVVFTASETKFFSFVNSDSYRYFKWNITANNGDTGYLAINDIQLYEEVDLTSQPSWYLYSTGAVVPNPDAADLYLYSTGAVKPNSDVADMYLYSNTIQRPASARSLSVYDNIILDNVKTNAAARSLAAYDAVVLDNVQTSAKAESLAVYDEVAVDPAKGKKIAMITTDPSHAAATNTKALFEERGHTVTVFTDSAVTATTNFDSFDVIAAVRASYNGTVWQDRVIQYMQNGKPVLMGFDQGLVSSTVTTSFPVKAKISTSVYGYDALSQAKIQKSHAITTGYTVDTNYYVYSSNTWAVTLYGTAIGSFLVRHISYNEPFISAIEKGTARLDGTPIGARAVFIGFLYGATGYTTDGKQLIENAVQWVTTPVTTKPRRHVMFI